MLRSLRLAMVASLAFIPRAQAQQPVPDSGDVRIFSGSFTAGSQEFSRVFLQKGQVYRAEINLGAVSFTLRPRRAGGEIPAVALIRGGAGSGESVYEIYPYRDDEYEIRVEDYPEGETATLTIYRDIHASARRQGIASRGGGWAFGVELGLGYHQNYQLSPAERSADIDRSGSDLEGCLVVSGPGGFWGCLFGLNTHTSDSTSRIVWFFVEPRYRVFTVKSGVSPEFGLLARGAFGANDTESLYNPSMIAPGAYLRISLGAEPGKGLSIGISGFHGFLLGRANENETFDQLTGAVSYTS